MSRLLNFSNYINDNVEALANEIVADVVNRLDLNIPEWEKQQAIEMYLELLRYFGKSIINKEEVSIPEGFISWSKGNAAMQISTGGEISEIVVRYPPTREVFAEIFAKISIEIGLSVNENGLILKQLNKLLDVSLNETIFAFEYLIKENNEKTQIQMAELSAPLILIKDGIAVLPLIGQLDDYKTKYITDHVIPKMIDMDINHVIADFSGILKIDLPVAQSLSEIGTMLRLMGIQVVSTGLRPEIAQTVVQGGLNLSGTNSFSNVKSALESIK